MDDVKDETPTEVPLFLRKTYHMIDSCDPAVAGWSEDGLTFVVKDPKQFESKIIPQFFKHSKFSSFVRQLNFYSFRKIKYMDTLRLLDPKVEKEVSQYWRFVHPYFQRGKPKLLTEIKRTNGHKSATTKNNTANNTHHAPATAKKVASVATTSAGANPDAMKNELDSLKKRIEEMNKNMTELTSMVQKVTLTSNSNSNNDAPAVNVKAEPNTECTIPASTANMVSPATIVGAKRKKLDDAAILPEPAFSALPPPADLPEAPSPQPLVEDLIEIDPADNDDSLIRPDEMLSSAMDYETVLPVDLTLAQDEPVHLQELIGETPASETAASPPEASPPSDNSQVGLSADDALDDLLFDGNSSSAAEDATIMDTTAAHLLPDPSALTQDSDEALQAPPSVLTQESGGTPQAPPPAKASQQSRVPSTRCNRPDPVLMERLSEALSILPKEMQEQIVERLIAAITTTDLFVEDASPNGLGGVNLIPAAHRTHSEDSDATSDDDESVSSNKVGMPLAAATLTALLSHYSEQVKKHHQHAAKTASANKENAKNNSSAAKSIPVIPVHA